MIAEKQICSGRYRAPAICPAWPSSERPCVRPDDGTSPSRSLTLGFLFEFSSTVVHLYELVPVRFYLDRFLKDHLCGLVALFVDFSLPPTATSHSAQTRPWRAAAVASQCTACQVSAWRSLPWGCLVLQRWLRRAHGHHDLCKRTGDAKQLLCSSRSSGPRAFVPIQQ